MIWVGEPIGWRRHQSDDEAVAWVRSLLETNSLLYFRGGRRALRQMEKVMATVRADVKVARITVSPRTNTQVGEKSIIRSASMSLEKEVGLTINRQAGA